MRVLFTNNTLAARHGTELYVCDVARELKRLGHEPAVYSPHLGAVAELLREAGIPVVRNLAALPFRPDIIHGHHHIETMTALASLPGVPAVYFCHGAKPGEEMPPVFPRILRYVAVDLACRERIVSDAAMPGAKITTLLNFVDTSAFQPRPPLPARAARALVFSNQATATNFAATVRAACEQRGIELDVRGLASGHGSNEPHELLPQYDIVFAKARAAIEAMAVGCAVVLCDEAGLGPMVSTGNFAELRPDNFGFRTLRNPLTVETITAAIHAYDPEDAEEVRDLVRSKTDMRDAVSEIVRLYAEVIAENAGRPVDPLAELRATGAYLQTLDSIIKHVPLGTTIIVPAEIVPDAIALPPAVKTSWLRRFFRIAKKQACAASGPPR